MLFIIMMNVLIHDTRDDLIMAIGDEAKDVHHILFADDTWANTRRFTCIAFNVKERIMAYY